MRQPIELDRRRFLQLAGSASLMSAARGRLGWAAVLPKSPRFACIGTRHAIHVYSVSETQCFVLQQTVPSALPVAMAVSNGRLYVANGVSLLGNLPRGSVEAYAMNATTGRLEFLNRGPLSLSATAPRDLAIAPDGRSLVVAVHGGGAYNVLPLEEDGRLGKVSGILKETGSGPHPMQTAAHPAAVIFDREGRVLTADQGGDKLSVLTLGKGRLAVAGRCQVAAGSGPTSMVMDPGGRRMYVAHALNGSLSSYRYDAAGFLHHTQTVCASGVSEVASLAMHPSGEILYSSHGNAIQTWKIAANGKLESLPGTKEIHAGRLHVMAEGDTLLALCSDAVLSLKIDASNGMLAAPVKVASLSAPISIAIA